MPEYRMTKTHIESARKRLDLLLKDRETYTRKYCVLTDEPLDYEAELHKICGLLMGIGIRNDRVKLPTYMRVLRGHGRMRILRDIDIRR